MGHKREINYPPGEEFSKLMLTLYKPWIKDVDEFLDKTMRNPKDSFLRHLRGYMLDEAFPKAIMMKIIRTKIALNFHSTEETNFGLDNGYSPTFNRNVAGVEEIYCEPPDNLVVNDHMDLGEEHFFQVR